MEQQQRYVVKRDSKYLTTMGDWTWMLSQARLFMSQVDALMMMPYDATVGLIHIEYMDLEVEIS